jgi:hypothetical protein
MSYPTYSTDNGVGITDITGDTQIGVGINGLVLTTGLLTTPTTTTINPSGFTTGLNNLPFGALYNLNQALQALEPAPNATTVQFNNSILLQDPSVPTDGITINNNSITSLTSLTTTSATDIFLTSGGLGDINLNAPNINSYGYAMPICFTRERTDSFSYGSGGQSMDNVYNATVAVPYQFFTEQPLGNYTSTKWKIDFALNCYNNTNVGDKGLALYFDFQDTTANTFTPYTYNANTPYAIYQPASSYGGGSSPPYQNFNWTDWCDFSVLQGLGSIQLPLNMRLYFAGDSPFSCNFTMAITFTRTNMI